jgi:hypothetical protein
VELLFAHVNKGEKAVSAPYTFHSLASSRPCISTVSFDLLVGPAGAQSTTWKRNKLVFLRKPTNKGIDLKAPNVTNRLQDFDPVRLSANALKGLLTEAGRHKSRLQ